LKGLHVSVNNKYATLWIIACIHLHAFAVKHEAVQNLSRDKFYREGRKYQKKQQQIERRWRQEQRRQAEETEEGLDKAEDVAILEGKLKRVELKVALLEHLGLGEYEDDMED